MARRLGALLFLLAWPLLAGNRHEISATLDPAKSAVQGEETISYVNQTGQPLESILLTCSGKVLRITDDEGRELRRAAEPLIGAERVFLPMAVAAGGSIRLRADFTARASSWYGYLEFSGDWHPKRRISREDRVRPLDSYDVTLTAPDNQVVVSSGRLILEKALVGGMRQYQFRADNITNFALSASPNAVRISRQVEGVAIHTYYLPEQKWGPKLAEYAARIVSFYKKTFGFYPQETLSIILGKSGSRGGQPLASNVVMVYDTLDEAGGEPFAEWITAHEIGHMYWGWECVLDDTRYYHWPGLAMGIYTDRLYTEAFNPAGLDNHRRMVGTYLQGVAAGNDTTMRRTWDEIEALKFDFNNIVAHGKAYAVTQMLEELIGRDKFFRLARLLQDRYRYRYLSPEDFQKTAEEVSGQKLDWFFSDWLESNKVLSYQIDGLEQSGGQVRVKVRRTGTAALPMDLELRLEDGTRLRKKTAREPESQTIVFDKQAKPRQARLNPDSRLALYSPEAKHVWGGKVEVVDVRMPEPLAWNTNTLSVVVRNTDDRPHEIDIDTQARSSSVPRAWGNNTKQTIAPGQNKTIEHSFIIPAFAGKVEPRLTITDLTEQMWLFRRNYPAEFPPANTRINPLRLPPSLWGLLKAEKSEYPALRVAERGHFVFYYLDGDSYVASRIDEVARRREKAYRELAAKINPAYADQVTIYLFPDADSKRVYTGHTGMGWAVGQTLVEIFNEKDRLDPNHELVHVIARSLGEPPALLSEGLATYFQENQRWDGYHIDAWAKAFATEKMLWPLPELLGFTDIGPEGSRPPIAYPQAASVIKYLVDRYGFDSVIRAYKRFNRSSRDEVRRANAEQFAQIFGATVDEVEQAWLASLRSISTDPIPAAKITELITKYR
jgi:hypothetical protein